MIFKIDETEVELLMDDVLGGEMELPNSIQIKLKNRFEQERAYEEIIVGFDIFFNMNKIKGGKLHTKLYPNCFEATIGELNVNRELSIERYEQYCSNFKNKQPATYRFFYTMLTEDAMFGAILAYNTLRRKDESNKLESLIKRI